MATLLFKLRGVPDDEQDEVRALLKEHGFNTYETQAGRWLIGVPAIWLADDHHLQEARELLAKYQAERLERVRREYAERQARGEIPGFWDRVAMDPAKMLGSILLVIGLLALMIVPFWTMF